MARGYGQRELINKQRELEIESTEKLPVKVGSIVEFADTPEFNGTIRKISKDQWQTIYIDYGIDGKSKIINGYEFIELVKRGKITVKKK